MSDFRGIWVALVTPFRDGEVDFVALHGLVKSCWPMALPGWWCVARPVKPPR